MKSNTIIFILIFLNFIACEDALEEVPKDFLSPVNYYQTKEDAEGAILGVYQANLGGDFIIGETYTGYFNVKGSWTAMGNLDQPLDATQYGRANGIWNRGYNIINRANVVLNRVPAIDMDEGEKKQILAEAYFLRAWAYLDLVRSYGPVPLRLMETRLKSFRCPKGAG